MTIAACLFYSLWQFMVSDINLPQKLTNTLLLSYTSCVKLLSSLRISRAAWLSRDKLMNYKNFQKHLFRSDSFLSLQFQEVSLLSCACNSFTLCLPLKWLPLCHLCLLSFHMHKLPDCGVKLFHRNNKDGLMTDLYSVCVCVCIWEREKDTLNSLPWLVSSVWSFIWPSLL